MVSVDASQGSEADCVIVSCVRSNKTGVIGFLEDTRRVNVALSRAKEVLYVVGDQKFFMASSDKNWKYVAKNCKLLNSL